MTRDHRRLSILSNNGDLGGGEVMLLSMAAAARDAGYQVTVAAPATPSACVDAASAAGHEVVPIGGSARRAYMWHLRRWASARNELLWCNGLVPALATAGFKNRVVHLHRLPTGHQRAAVRLARRSAREVVVPSRFMAASLGDSPVVLPNWTSTRGVLQEAPGTVQRLGFLGRLAPEKGVDVLLDAFEQLIANGCDLTLLIAGEPRFVSEDACGALTTRLASMSAGVKVLGWVDAAEFFRRIDALVVPSVGEESFGLTAAEAMAAGVPVVVSDAGALPEVVGTAHPFVARRGDVGDLARVIQELVRDAATRQSATSAAADRWHANFSSPVGEKRFVELLTSLSTEGSTS